MPGSDWDAIVVGAGHNGLVAANVLANHGWRVVVLEAADRPGGAVRSEADVVAPGYVTDLFSAFYPLAVASPVIRSLRLEQHGLAWCHAPDVLAHVLPDGRAVRLSRDPVVTAASLDGFASGDGAAWTDLVTEWRRIGDPLTRALLDPFPPVRATVGLARALGPTGTLRLARTAAATAYEWTRERFDGEGARALVAGNAAHADLPLTASGSAAFGWLLAMLGQSHGFPVPRGGAGALTQALVDRLVAKGGTVRTGARVARVLISDGMATGVSTATGEEVLAPTVLADVDAPHLYRDLVGTSELPTGLREDLDRFTWDPSTVKVNWALDAPVPWVAPEARSAGTVHLGGDLDGIADYAHALATDRVPAEPFVLLGQMTTTDPSRSPAGTESVWAYTHLPRRDWAEADVVAVADRVQALVERHAPGFCDRVVGRSVQGPHELGSVDRSLQLGSINGGTAQVFQQLVLRPTPGLGRAETFVDGLYLAGSSAHPGGGVHGACGRNAARAALLRRRGSTAPVGRALTFVTRRLAGAGS
jgi:phytoene dehydrogenase-like protein